MEENEDEYCTDHYRDRETGERVLRCRHDPDTGEEDLCNAPKQIFRIPSAFYQPKLPVKIANQSKNKCDKLQPQKSHNHPKTADICSPRTAAAILFLLPTLLFFTPAFSVIIVLAEVILHVWAHRKNRQCRHENIRYQSPLHIIIQEFCAACKDENAKMKISRLQGARADKFKKYSIEYVRRIVNKKLLIT